MTRGADARFWRLADDLVGSHQVVIDRPRGSEHPSRTEIVYPLDYGFLSGTTAVDGDGIDVWRGSLPEQRVTGVIVTIDAYKRDAELKLLIGCTPAETELALQTHDQPSQAGLLIQRPNGSPEAGAEA